MERLKKVWFGIPHHIRKPIVLVVGSLFIIAAGLTGWLPGPGGIPLFLVGIAILATEFEWAKRVRDFILHYLHSIGSWLKAHLALSILLITALVAIFCFLMYRLFF